MRRDRCLADAIWEHVIFDFALKIYSNVKIILEKKWKIIKDVKNHKKKHFLNYKKTLKEL